MSSVVGGNGCATIVLGPYPPDASLFFICSRCALASAEGGAMHPGWNLGDWYTSYTFDWSVLDVPDAVAGAGVELDCVGRVRSSYCWTSWPTLAVGSVDGADVVVASRRLSTSTVNFCICCAARLMSSSTPPVLLSIAWTRRAGAACA